MMTIICNFSVLTDKKIDTKRSDIVIKEKGVLPINMTFQQVSNVSKKAFQKLSNYQYLQIKVTKMWTRKTTIIPVVVGGVEYYIEGDRKSCEYNS